MYIQHKMKGVYIMIDLKELVGSKVRIVDIDDITYEGIVDEYIDAEDNVPEEIESIILTDLLRLDDGEKFSNPIEFKATEIISVYSI